jgi:hypothetical protein
MPPEEGTAVNSGAVQDTAPAAPAPAEETKLEVVTEGPAVNPKDIREVEDEDLAGNEADDTTGDGIVEESKAPQGEKELNPKSENRFQKLANENRELKARIAAQEAQVAQEQELLGEINPETGDYYTPAEAERIARTQYLQAQQQNLARERGQLEVQQNVDRLASEANQITQDVPMLREFNSDGTKNPEYNAEIAANYDGLLADNLLYQLPNGGVYTAGVLMQNSINPETQATLVGSYNSPYKLANIVANAYKASAVANQIKGQKATERMLSQADNPTGTKPARATSKDEANMSPEEYAKAHGLEKVWQ